MVRLAVVASTPPYHPWELQFSQIVRPRASISDPARCFAHCHVLYVLDLDCIERIRKLKPSRSCTKDIMDELLREYPEDTTTIVSNYQRLFERAH